MKKPQNIPELPDYMKSWINIKKVFPVDYFSGEKDINYQQWTDPHKIYESEPQVKGINDMLSYLNMCFKGQEHSGIDDAKNIARCVVELVKQGFVFTTGMVYRRKY